MAKKWRDLMAKMSPESQARAQTQAEEMLRDMPLFRLRVARGVSEDGLASALGTTPNHVLIIERRADHFLSSARRYVEAMGGRLEIAARFPDRAYRLDLVPSEPGGDWDQSPRATEA